MLYTEAKWFTQMHSNTNSNKNFYKDSGYYVVTSAIASLVNYSLYPILSKLISPSELGDVGVIFTIIVQASSVLLAFNVISIYLVAREAESSAIAKLEVIQRGLLRLFSAFGLIIIFSLPLLKHALHIEGFLPFIGLAALLIASIPAVIWTGYLQGHKELKLIGSYNLINALLKVFGATTFAALGFGAGGAVIGAFIGFSLALFGLRFFSPHRLPSVMASFRKASGTLMLRSIRSYILEAVLVATTLSIFYSLDILSAKILFSREQAGIYVGASTLGGTAYYAIMTLAWIVLSHFSPTSNQHNVKLLFKAVGLSALGATSLIFVFYFFSEQIVRIALGDNYLPINNILWKVCLSQAIIAATAMVAFSLLVLRWWGALLLSIILVAVSGIAIVLSRKTYTGLADAMLVGEVVGWSLFLVVVKFKRFFGV